MSMLSKILAVLALTVVAGGAAFVAAYDIPPPSNKVEKVIPDERFPR